MLVRRVLKRLDHVLVREHFSAEALRRMGLGPPQVVETGDLAFALDLEPDVRQEEWAQGWRDRLGGQPLVAMTVRDWSFPRRGEEGRENYVSVMAAVIDDLAAKGYRTVLLPQVTGPAADDDRVMSRRVKEAARSRSAVVLTERVDPGHLLAFMRHCRLVVGTRMHSVIFALLAGVPVVAVAYAHKTYGIMQAMGLSEYVVDIQTIRTDETFQRVHEALRRADGLGGHIRSHAGALRVEVREAVDGAVRKTMGIELS
jgi:colanic acid/amylovoran biosynthesis protein